jgi:chromosome partitioning protein
MTLESAHKQLAGAQHMTVIAVMNQKGGVGKTTTCTGLAGALHHDKRDVVLVDSDKQGSILDYAAAHEAQPIPVFVIERSALAREIPKLKNEFVIIDGTAKAEDLAKKTIEVADLILIPVTPSPLDVWATSDMVTLVQDRIDEQTAAGETPVRVAFVVNRAIHKTKLGKKISKTLEDYGFPVLVSRLMQRQEHPNAQLIGRSPLDTRPRGAAANDLRALKDEVLAFLAS